MVPQGPEVQEQASEVAVAVAVAGDCAAREQAILRVAGASAALIACLDSKQLPVGAVEAADMVATSLNNLSEETLQDALAAVHAEIEDDAETA